jgi:hypothetical protein
VYVCVNVSECVWYICVECVYVCMYVWYVCVNVSMYVCCMCVVCVFKCE